MKDQSDDASSGRRAFLTRVTLALGAGVTALAGIPVVGFILGPLIRRTPSTWRAVGSVSAYRVGETVEAIIEDPAPQEWAGVSARAGVWLRRDGQAEFTAFSIHCTHLGCPVRWLGDAEIFMCPCHGGVFYRDGRVAAGPPELPLRRHDVRVRDGTVEVRTRPVPIT
jgi:menaquinol-cytochrome c reductase iron-sulfur subunit